MESLSILTDIGNHLKHITSSRVIQPSSLFFLTPIDFFPIFYFDFIRRIKFFTWKTCRKNSNTNFRFVDTLIGDTINIPIINSLRSSKVEKHVKPFDQRVSLPFFLYKYELTSSGKIPTAFRFL